MPDDNEKPPVTPPEPDERPESGQRGYGQGDYGAGPYGGAADTPLPLNSAAAIGLAGTMRVATTGAAAGLSTVSGIGGVANPAPAVLGIQGYSPVVDVSDAPPAASLWMGTGSDVFFQIDKAERELEAIRSFYLALQAQGVTDPRAHNNPPELLGIPEIDSDIELIEAAIQCLTILRPLLMQPEPNFEIVTLLWRVVLIALRAVGRMVAWAARITISVFKKFAETTLGDAYMKALGAGLGTATAAFIVYEIASHGPGGLQAVAKILNGALTALGHPAG